MDENNGIQNQMPNVENNASSQDGENSVNRNETTNPLNADGEIELDPELEGDSAIKTDEFVGTIPQAEGNVPPKQDPLPIPPAMPTIEKTEYIPVKNKNANRGMKVFALAVAAMVALSGCVTAGYYLGRLSATGGKEAVVDLASKPAPDNAVTASQVYANVNPSVVGIYVYNSSGIGATATGVIYSKDGYVVTNDHIYDDVVAAKFKVYTSEGKSFDADYVAGDTRSDLAVIKIKNPTGLKPAVFGNSNEIAVGENVVAIGKPNGATSSATASEGIISVISTRVSTTSTYTSKLIQTDTAINPGSSGGALCNLYSQVIGITSAKLVGDYEGVSYAIPTTTVKKVVESLIKHKSVKNRARLGISYRALDELSAEIAGLPSGLQIASIDSDSDLYGKSVGTNDIITHINGTKITDSNIVLDIIDNSSPGDILNLTVYSAKTKKSLDISVKLLEDAGSSSYSYKSDSKTDHQYNSSEFGFPNGE